LDGLAPTSRKFPFVGFKPNREIGNNVLRIDKLGCECEGKPVLRNFSLIVNKNDKIAFAGSEHRAKAALFDCICGVRSQDSGDFYWGQTTSFSYFPRENSAFFKGTESIVDWLRQYSSERDETYVRGFLGRMLFSGDEALKPVNVLSGGEKVRCMLSKMMLSGANVLVLDEPTNHLDLESITALNNGLIAFPGVVMFNSRDHEFVSSIANRVVEILPDGLIDRMMPFDDYLADADIKELREAAYADAAASADASADASA
ncbi:MAG: ATP-binding cassette domain-containing protein, partial [Spirochaetaceae bacterium]|nr:ATP-binding cassette domain-containing protein [Spirochaetaceae bacterium]